MKTNGTNAKAIAKAPRDGSNDGNNEGTKKTSAEECLEAIRHTPEVFFSLFNVHQSDTGNKERARDNTELLPNHESSKATCLVLKEEPASLLGKVGPFTFALLKLGNGKMGDLHSLKITNNAEEDEEDSKGGSWWDRFPHLGISSKESCQGDDKGKAKTDKGQEASEPEEHILNEGAGWLIGFKGVSSKFADKHVDNTGQVENTTEFDGHGDPECECSKPVIDCSQRQGAEASHLSLSVNWRSQHKMTLATVLTVKHAMASIDLRVELTHHVCEENHGNTRCHEDGQHHFGQSPEFSVFDSFTGQVNGENNQNDHELMPPKGGDQDCLHCWQPW